MVILLIDLPHPKMEEIVRDVKVRILTLAYMHTSPFSSAQDRGILKIVEDLSRLH